MENPKQSRPTWGFRSVVLSAIVIFALYEAFLRLPIFSMGGGVCLSAMKNNLIRIQRYYYDYNHPDVVVLGTSISNRLILHKMSERVFNLSQAYLSVPTGLYLIDQKKEKPKYAVIEINYALQLDPNEEVVRYLSSPLNFLGTYFKSLRAEYRPVVVTKFLLKQRTGRHLHMELGMPQRVDQTTGRLVVQDEIATNSSGVVPRVPTTSDIESKLEAMGSKFLPPTKKRLASIKNYIEKFEAQGIKVIFLKVPQPFISKKTPPNEDLSPAEKLAYSEHVFRTQFPDIPWIMDQEQGYTQSDNLHLDQVSAIRFTRYFKSRLQDLNIL